VRLAGESTIGGFCTVNPVNPVTRWDALDVLRGLTIMLMLLHLAPGSWGHHYAFLVHSPWEGWALVDMVAPGFLFCIGVAMPLSFERRSRRDASRGDLLRHVFWRALLLIAIGFLLNLYPTFDFAKVRIPGVLQRIGLCYLLCGVFMLVTARRMADGSLMMRWKPLALAAIVILVSYWALLWFVPLPGRGAPGFDPEWNWAAVIDRAVIGVDHLFRYWPVNGRVVFDPEGLLSTWPACFNVLLGALAGIVYSRRLVARPELAFLGVGAALMALAYAWAPVNPIIKNIWTGSFALFSGGFALATLGVLAPVTHIPGARHAFWPVRVFGENPLLAYILITLLAPPTDAPWFGTPEDPKSLRAISQAWFEQWLSPHAASLTFGLCVLCVLFAILLVCHRRRWILKL
jgi:predicted acyltransferase